MLATFLLPCLSFTSPTSVRAHIDGSRVMPFFMAEGGPPQIDWQDATVVANKELSRGTKQLTIQADAEVEYRPGHIIGLEVAHPETGDGLKGPYTVSRSSGSSFDVIYRVIPDGRKTPFMETLSTGARVRFGGRFGTPVADGIADDVDRVVGIATGAGLGPLVGYAEDALEAGSSASIELYGGFRDLADVCCKEETGALAARHPGFKCMPVISRPMACAAVSLSGLGSGLGGGMQLDGIEAPPPAFVQGRVSTAVPGLLGPVSPSTHFHLVGNGQFVADFEAGLLAAGVAEERITTEKYFNGKAEADKAVVEHIAEALQARAAV